MVVDAPYWLSQIGLTHNTRHNLQALALRVRRNRVHDV